MHPIPRALPTMWHQRSSIKRGICVLQHWQSSVTTLPIECGRSDTVWFPKLSHKQRYSFHWAPSPGTPPLEPATVSWGSQEVTWRCSSRQPQFASQPTTSIPHRHEWRSLPMTPAPAFKSPSCGHRHHGAETSHHSVHSLNSPSTKPTSKLNGCFMPLNFGAICSYWNIHSTWFLTLTITI